MRAYGNGGVSYTSGTNAFAQASYDTSFKDTSTVLTTVTVTGADNYEFKDIPIAKSMEIPANSTKVVEWYIMNPKGSSNNLSYTLEGLYLGL